MDSKLFDTSFLGGVLKNRFVRSATWEGMAHEEAPALLPLST